MLLARPTYTATATADHIYVLDGGRLVEEGDHASLMRRPAGRYRQMYTAQAGQYGVTAGTGTRAAPPVPGQNGFHEKRGEQRG